MVDTSSISVYAPFPVFAWITITSERFDSLTVSFSNSHLGFEMVPYRYNPAVGPAVHSRQQFPDSPVISSQLTEAQFIRLCQLSAHTVAPYVCVGAQALVLEPHATFVSVCMCLGRDKGSIIHWGAGGRRSQWERKKTEEHSFSGALSYAQPPPCVIW